MSQIKSKKTIFLLIFFALIFASPFCAHALELVPCKDNCNLCDIISGMKRIFDYLGIIIVAVVTVFIIIAGILYMFSSGSKNLMELAKKTFITVLAGFLLYHFSWLVVDAILKATGYNKVTNWWQFDCQGSADIASNESQTASEDGEKKAETKCDQKDRKLDSIKIQCDEKDFKLEGDGTGFYIVLDTLSEDDKGKTKQLKAVAKYTCQKSDGSTETSEENITAQAEWKASDETQIKVAKGLVQAVTTSLGSSSESPPYVEAKYQEKNSNQAKVYINSCPNTETAGAETKDKFSFLGNSLNIPKVNAQVPGKPTFNTEGCTSCGENNTCHFSGGNPSAEFIFILVRSNDTNVRNKLCPFSQSDWEEDGSHIIEPPVAAQIAENESEQNLPYFDSKFAIYWSSKILDVNEKDENCPEAKYSSYGYIFSGTGKKARAIINGSAQYCEDALIQPNVFSHEQIGHSFGHLDDEYTNLGKDYRNYFQNSFGYTLNCTPDKNCPKWKNRNLSQECVPGCLYSTTEFYRSSSSSIMKSDSNATFGSVNTFILKYWAIQWPKGPWNELGDLISPVKETIIIEY